MSSPPHMSSPHTSSPPHMSSPPQFLTINTYRPSKKNVFSHACISVCLDKYDATDRFDWKLNHTSITYMFNHMLPPRTKTFKGRGIFFLESKTEDQQLHQQIGFFNISAMLTDRHTASCRRKPWVLELSLHSKVCYSMIYCTNITGVKTCMQSSLPVPYKESARTKTMTRSFFSGQLCNGWRCDI